MTLLRDADPGRYNRALAACSGRQAPPGYQQPMVLTGLITLADARGYVTAEQLDKLPGMTALPKAHVDGALDKLAKSGWIYAVIGGGCGLTAELMGAAS